MFLASVTVIVVIFAAAAAFAVVTKAVVAFVVIVFVNYNAISSNQRALNELEEQTYKES